MRLFYLVTCFAFFQTCYTTPASRSQKLQTSPENTVHDRLKRQSFDFDSDKTQTENTNPNCVFGSGSEVTLCQWKNLNQTLEKWMISKGENYVWLGGPPLDNTAASRDGGYALYETSRLVDTQFTQTLAQDSAVLMSPLLKPTNAIGTCIDFWYAMDGLSQDRLRILLRPPPHNLVIGRGDLNVSQLEFFNNLILSDGRDDIVLWENRDSTSGSWVNGQVVYSFNDRHLIIFEGLPLTITDPNRAYRGYIAVDDLNMIDATECKPFCNFEGGFCSWEQDSDDDFDWSLGIGSVNPSTGPPMDRFSFNYGIKGGGYAFINSDFPRSPNDKARLMSEVFSPPGPNAPLCLRFWTHMYGNGIGALRIIIAPVQGKEEVIWELEGEQGNNWYQGQVTITATSDFQIVIEGEVGPNNLGDIAIDEIALKENACPTSPQSASKFKGDCTFEVDECGWKNIQFRQRLDELDWERVIASLARSPSKDHTLNSNQGSFMSLPRTSIQRGERGWLMSPTMTQLDQDICISFWYFMYDPFIEATGPSLGSLSVILMEQNQQGFQTLTPLWSLKNHQAPTWLYGQTSISSDKTFTILFEGLWGNSRGGEYIAIDDVTFFMGKCETRPERATTSILDCDFTRDSCTYMNSSSISRNTWVTATISRRPSTLPDHTFGGPIGYLYFDVFNTNGDPPQMTLMSRVVEGRDDQQPICLTFWFAPIGNDPDTKLMVNREIVDASSNDAEGQTGSPSTIWSVDAKDHFETRIEWMFGQTQVDTSSDYKISFVGQARKGGFALDDIQVNPGSCSRRPAEVVIDDSTN